MFDVSQLIGAVVGNTGGARVADQFRLDTVDYSWVKDYRRDQELRAEAEELRKKIIDAQKLPIHKDELRVQFEGEIKRINEFRIRQIRGQLSSVQRRENPIYGEFSIGYFRVLDAIYFPYMINLSPADLDAVFSEMDEGVKQKGIDKTVEDCQKRIKEIETIIEKELSPENRWFYRDDGKPYPYPKGCRWTNFVAVWEGVQSRFDGAVTINGKALKTDAEFMVHAVLKLDKVQKLTPLRKPL